MTINISDYLKEIQHAVEVIIGEIYREYNEVESLIKEVDKLNAATNAGYNRADFLALNPDLDDDGLGTAAYFDTYFGPDKERFQKENEMDCAVMKLQTHEFSIVALSGSVLQYAKQGISLKYGKYGTGCPQGRIIRGQSLKDIIWQGRNQALHWEEGTFSNSVEQCFQNLANNSDPIFNDYTKRNMAFDVITLLVWKTFNDFSNDMKRLLI
jgi:hypothetical protein